MIWYNSASLRIFFELLDDIILEKQRKVFYKPHPNEAVDGYGHFEKKYGKNFVFDKDSPFSQWLPRLNAMVVNCSTSIAEGLMNNVPVICVHKIIGGRLYDHTRKFPIDAHMPLLRFCYMPSTVSECVGLVEKAYRNELKPAPMSPDLLTILREVYDWPRKEPSVETIAKEIDKMSETIRNERKSAPSGIFEFPGRPRFMMFLGIIRSMITYIRRPLQFKLDREYNYCFLHRQKYVMLAKKIMAALKIGKYANEQINQNIL